MGAVDRLVDPFRGRPKRPKPEALLDFLTIGVGIVALNQVSMPWNLILLLPLLCLYTLLRSRV